MTNHPWGMCQGNLSKNEDLIFILNIELVHVLYSSYIGSLGDALHFSLFH